MSTSASSEEVKTEPKETVDFVTPTLKVAGTKNGDIILVPQPSDDPEDPLVSTIIRKLATGVTRKDLEDWL